MRKGVSLEFYLKTRGIPTGTTIKAGILISDVFFQGALLLGT